SQTRGSQTRGAQTRGARARGARARRCARSRPGRQLARRGGGPEGAVVLGGEVGLVDRLGGGQVKPDRLRRAEEGPASARMTGGGQAGPVTLHGRGQLPLAGREGTRERLGVQREQ